MLARGLVAALVLLVPILTAQAALPPEIDRLDPAVYGRWDAPFEIPVQGEYAVILPTGEVLLFAFGPDAHLWNATTGAVTPVPAPYNINCVGISLMADGRVLIMGGHEGDSWHGTARSLVFDPWQRTWTPVPDLQIGRYYPGAVQLADGRVLVVSGNGPDGGDAPTPEVYDGAAWTLLPQATQYFEFYPRMHVLPGGDVVTAGQDARAFRLDVDTMTWTPGPVSPSGIRWGGVSALLADLETVLVFGGGNTGFSSEGGLTGVFRDDAAKIADNLAHGTAPATNGAQLLDTGANEWREAAPLLVARRDGQAVLLPTGDVLAVGGAYGFEPIPGWAEHALSPEIYTPSADSWQLLAPASRHRGYHSTSVLLPDGRVLVSGGDFETGIGSIPAESRTGEIFAPPYLFQGPRPELTHAPTSVALGAAMDVRSSGSVDAFALVRASSITHSTNADQRVVPLTFAPGADGRATVNIPADAGAVPPGWYMLFAIASGVPSEARMVQVLAS